MPKENFVRLFLFLVMGAFLLAAAPAKADLMIAPLRVVFKNRDRSAIVSIINTSVHVNTYRVGWEVMRAGADGKYVRVKTDDKDPFSFNKMVIFSPRQVVINPGEHQVVRLSLRRPADLPPGEYRAHLMFTRLPPDKSRKNARDEGRTGIKKKGAGTTLDINLGFSIPVIVRNGSDDTHVELSQPKFEMVTSGKKIEPVLSLSLDRVSGVFSTYGSVRVFWKQPGKEERRVGILNNVALYPEMKHRDLKVSLMELGIKGGTIRVVYEGKYESQGVIWDEKTFPVGG
jgi:P pilus assembly chaperone PapD